MPNAWKTILLAITVVAIGFFFYPVSDSTTPGVNPKVVTDETSIDTAPTIALIDDQRINNAETEPGNWLAYGRTYEEQRFSPLEQINQQTVGKLGLAWFTDMRSNRALESTPIVVDDMMFVTSAWSRVYALDARTGREIWYYDPKVPGEWARKACCDVVNRGVAVYKGRVYVASLDGYLIALDAATGTEIWRKNTLIDRSRDYTITGAPRVARGKVFIGNGGAEFGVRGYVTAYDAVTGEQVWRFYTVPGDPAKPFEHPEMALAASTWKGGEWWKIGGGGTVWNSIVYDPDFNHLYLGVGNGSPWTRVIRSPGGGDNLFLSSIVALDADTGVMKWYYQTTPGDNWDYTAVQDMVLADMEVDGVDRKVLMQAPKNGFFYVLNRENGELLRAHKYVSANWATHVDMESGRPVEDPALGYLEDSKWVLPGAIGGHNWQAMSFDKRKGIMYIPAMENPLAYAMNDEWKNTGTYKHVVGGWNTGIEFGRIVQVMSEAGDPPKARGILKAFNPLTGKESWAVEQLHYWNGGVLATAGELVFQGNSLGEFNAFNADNGERLWSFNAYTAFLAPPISYKIDGVQYVAIQAGTGGGELFTGEVPHLASVKYGNFGKLLVFKLNGDIELPVPNVIDRTIPEQPEMLASEADVKRGERLYHENCGFCHGLMVRAGGVIPDLRLMPKAKHALFKQIVLDGILSVNGMASFSDLLNETDVDRIEAYVISRANEDRQAAE
ncbi:MAG: PQQ-dependent dehydrogenase, methanol/ethanol family [Pseudomonadales bacterium]|nr:PQQ-dependent dehydrogenase, methanol/ethanol family [Pseudomonadales bacterium]